MTNDSKKGRYTNPEGSATWEYISTISCTSLIFCIGSIFGWFSPSLVILNGPNATFPFTDSDASILAAAICLGFLGSPVLTSVMADKLGRKSSLLIVNIAVMVNWGLIAVAKDVSVLFLARFIAGLAASLGICMAPMYLGEIASVRLRGALGTVIGTMTNAGLLCVYVAQPHLSISAWAYICLGLSTASMISLLLIPESPYFLVMIGRLEEAEDALEKLRGTTNIAEELELIQKTVNHKWKEEEQTDVPSKASNPFKQLLTVPGNRKALWINLLFVIALQCGGYTITMAFSHAIFKAMDTGLSENICATIVALLQLAFNILTVFVVDKFGRRPLLLISGVTSGVCILIIGVYFYLMEYTKIDVTPYGMFALNAMFVNISALSVGLMPLQLVIQCEILATEVKALVSTLGGILGGLLSAIMNILYLKLTISWGFGQSVPFLSFSLVTWTTTALILKMLPETKGKTFLEIQRDLNA